MTIINEHHADGSGQLVLARDGVRLGTLDYRRAGNGPLYIDYVEVLPSLRGGGVGRRLVEAAVTWARESQTTIVPICSYSRSVIEGDAALRDVLR
ncbi:MAG: GNAT family N-acetyltransferase [Vicinamibacterales bacterium]